MFEVIRRFFMEDLEDLVKSRDDAIVEAAHYRTKLGMERDVYKKSVAELQGELTASKKDRFVSEQNWIKLNGRHESLQANFKKCEEHSLTLHNRVVKSSSLLIELKEKIENALPRQITTDDEVASRWMSSMTSVVQTDYKVELLQIKKHLYNLYPETDITSSTYDSVVVTLKKLKTQRENCRKIVESLEKELKKFRIEKLNSLNTDEKSDHVLPVRVETEDNPLDQVPPFPVDYCQPET